MRAVLETNIIVSRFLTPSGLAARLFALWREDRFELLVSEPILAEVQEVLLRPSIRSRHGLTASQVVEAVAGFRRFAILVVPAERVAASKDPDDDKFLECALAGSAEVIVSRDPDLLVLRSFRGIRIVTPPAFLAAIEVEGGEPE